MTQITLKELFGLVLGSLLYCNEFKLLDCGKSPLHEECPQDFVSGESAAERKD